MGDNGIMADGSIVIDPGVATAIGGLFTVATGAVGWLVSALWKDRADLQKQLLDMLTAQFQDNETRRALADKQNSTVDQLRSRIEDLGRLIDSLRQDVARKLVG